MNNDNIVDDKDVSAFWIVYNRAAYNEPIGVTDLNRNLDINGNLFVSLDDLQLILLNFNNNTPTLGDN